MKIGGTSLLGLLVFYITVGTAAQGAGALRETPAITCFQGMSEKVLLRSTDRLPHARGEARVEHKGGTTEIEITLDDMKPALLFGGDYNTYVLWVVSPGGRVENGGELALDGDRSRLSVTADATKIALLVTAEPHYLVRTPSAFVVLESSAETPGSTLQYAVIEGFYNFERDTLDGTKEASRKVHTEIQQAFTAVRLAQRANAHNLVPLEFAEADRALDETLNLSRQGITQTEIAVQARDTIRLAVAAQDLAENRAFQEARVHTEGSGGGDSRTGRR
jgi:hypothetical protein